MRYGCGCALLGALRLNIFFFVGVLAFAFFFASPK